MKNFDKRHFCGCLMPNIFFLLQVGIIILLLSIALQLIELFNLSNSAIYAIIVVAIVAVIYYFSIRRDVIARQYKHCDEYSKQEKEKTIKD